MNLLERIDLLEAVEEGRISRDDPRYVALVEEENRKAEQRRADLLTRIRKHEFSTHREISKHYGVPLALICAWKQTVQRKGQMVEAEWRRCLSAACRKRKKAGANQEGTPTP